MTTFSRNFAGNIMLAKSRMAFEKKSLEMENL